MIYLNPMLYWAIEENPLKSGGKIFPADFVYPLETNYMLSLHIPKDIRLSLFLKAKK